MPLFDDDELDDTDFSLNSDDGGDGDGGPGADDQTVEQLQQLNEELITLVEILLQRFVGATDESRFSYSYGEGWREEDEPDEVTRLRHGDIEEQLSVVEELIERYR